jgi:hypothetical protein
MAEFVSGLELSRRFYFEAVRPILSRRFPRLRYSAGLLGWGSEVLGFDTPISRDHHWGPRVLIFLGDKKVDELKDEIESALSSELPYEFMGYSTSFGDAEPNGVRHPVKRKSGKVSHMIQVFSIRSFFQARLGVDPYKKISAARWLTFPQQRLLELTSGEVFYDSLGELEKVREKFRYYPRDVWLYILAAQWKKFSQHEAFVGRAGEVGDELGSRLIASEIVNEIIGLCFLMERRYMPYSKWLGRAFGKLAISRKIAPILSEVLSADNWRSRETRLSKAYSVIAAAHNKLGVTKPLPTRTSNYFSRPYKVIHADVFSEEILKAITSSAVKRLRPNIGSVDQFASSTDLLSDMSLCRELEYIY